MKHVVSVSVLLLGLLLLAGCNPVRPLPAGMAGETTATVEPPADVSSAAPGAAADGDTAAIMAALLARQLGSDGSEVTVVSSEAVEWPDACLGLRLEGEMCAQVITPGYKVILSVNGNTYTYHTDQSGSWYRLVEGPDVHVGESIADPAWQRALLAWARVTRAELETGQTSATARTAMSWQLGPIPDAPEVCAHLTVLDYGYAYAEQRACEGAELVSSTEDWLNQEEMQQFDAWLYAYAPLYVDDSYLNGVGQEQMPEGAASAVQAWAEALWLRLTGMPVVPADSAGDSANGASAGIAAGAACDAPAAGSQVYGNDDYGFCILVPEGYSVVETVPGSFSLVAGGDIMNHTSPRIGIEVTAAGDRTLAGIAGQMMQDYAPVGTDVLSQTITVDDDQAVLLDNLPGQDLNRRVVVLHNGLVYSIMFMPLSPEAESFYQSVLESLRFLN